MKELTIEEKAEAYDKVSKEVKDFFEGRQKMFSDVTQTLEYLFPELKESEDEKWIPKEIAKYLKEKGGFRSCWLAWLEKQCEQKETPCDKCKKEQPSHSCQDITELGRCALEKQNEQNHANSTKTCKDEQNPAWSEEDENYYQGCLKAMKTYGGNDTPISKWIESLKDRVQPQPKQEWSVCDEDMLNDVEESLEAYSTKLRSEKDFMLADTVKKEMEWVKSLKSRVKPKQEWSEEDEEYLRRAVNATKDKYPMTANWLKCIIPQKRWKPSNMELEVLRLAAEKDGTCLMGLYEQLKKL